MNAVIPTDREMDEITESGLQFYRENIKPILEPQQNGKAVAIHVPTGDYAVGKSHSEATKLLLQRHEMDGKVVSMTIGPPTERDIRMAQLFQLGSKS